jgi:signal transduction histidine kinase
MRRGPKSARSKGESKGPVARKPSKNDGATVRDLQNRLAEALARETATSEILRVISSSPTDSQPVFDTIARSAMDLCSAALGVVTRYDGDLIHLAAHSHVTAEGAAVIGHMFPMRPARTGIHGRIILEGGVVHIPDAQADEEYSQSLSQALHLRSAVGVPMVRDGRVIGAVAVGRVEVCPFTDQEIALLRTFAAQAVIAIENVRLFTETKEALEQQTATSEILRVISSSPTDVQPVFDAIAENALRLCGAAYSVVGRYDGQLLHLAAHAHVGAEGVEAMRRLFPMRPSRTITSTRAILDRSVVHLADALEDPEYDRPTALAMQNRATLAVPMLRDGEPIGTIFVGRPEPQPFTGKQIELLLTFADQAVIAIENVRLFKELEASNREIAEKSRQIEVASQHKSEFLANMSHELRTPLNAIIGFSEVLSERMFGDLNEKQEEYLRDISGSGQHLLSLINDILDLSKIEAGRMELELTDFDLPTAIDNALMLVRERAGRRSITLNTAVGERLGQVRADERKVRQVVLNLLSNAIKFTPDGGQIEVRAEPRDGSVEISVRDTGVGIAPEDLEAVFEEFRQVGTADKKVEGTGLGLTLCRKFVELHGGRIWVKSEVGVGSTFTFSLPLGCS